MMMTINAGCSGVTAITANEYNKKDANHSWLLNANTTDTASAVKLRNPRKTSN